MLVYFWWYNTAHFREQVYIMVDDVQIAQVRKFLLLLQDTICHSLEVQESLGGIDGASHEKFIDDVWERAEGGGGRSCVLSGGQVIEKAGVMFSHIHVDQMPASATARHPALAGQKAEALGVSLVVHPKNPHVPTSHANVRLFVTKPTDGSEPIWWFGGGFDLTPFYPVVDDCVHWHKVAHELCQAFDDDVYPKFKTWCDEYFYLKHRGECRGVGGLFFDDVNTDSMGWDFDKCFAFIKAVGHGYLKAILPIFDKRRNTPYTPHERAFQLYRRGRYVEYNLVYDRGTLFGLQSNGRTESILVSMPPLASWAYRYEPVIGSREFELTDFYLKPKDWLSLDKEN